MIIYGIIIKNIKDIFLYKLIIHNHLNINLFKINQKDHNIYFNNNLQIKHILQNLVE